MQDDRSVSLFSHDGDSTMKLIRTKLSTDMDKENISQCEWVLLLYIEPNLKGWMTRQISFGWSESACLETYRSQVTVQ